jgi:hypothetical protein
MDWIRKRDFILFFILFIVMCISLATAHGVSAGHGEAENTRHSAKVF